MADVGRLQLGNIIAPDRECLRDAVHVAVIPQVNTSGTRLLPGQGMPGGIVDPFLDVFVAPGERYWLWLIPGSVEALRHHWEHPLFPNADLPAAVAATVASAIAREQDDDDDFDDDDSCSGCY